MRRRLRVEVDGDIAIIRGWEAQKLALQAGIRPTYNGISGGWVFDVSRVPDFVAGLEYRNIQVDIDAPGPTDTLEPAQGDGAELALFDLGGSL